MDAPVSPPLPPTTGSFTSKTVGATSFLKSSGGVNQKKLAEARELAQEGGRHMKTSIFQWKPDHVAAASFFERSADCYRIGGDLDNARLMLVGAADSHEQSGAHSACALALVKAAKVAHEQTQTKEATRLYLRAAEAWGTHGNSEKCSDCFLKAAIEIEDTNLNKSLEFYRRAVDLIYPPDTATAEIARLSPSAIETCREFWGVLLRRDLLGDAIAFSPRLIALFAAFESESSLHKTLCAVSVLQLRAGDVVAAHETYLQDHLSRVSYRASCECRLAENLIMSYVHLDPEALEAARSSSDMRFIDREVARLIKDLSLFAAKNKAPKPTAVMTVPATTIEDETAISSIEVEQKYPDSADILIEDFQDDDEIDLT